MAPAPHPPPACSPRPRHSLPFRLCCMLCCGRCGPAARPHAHRCRYQQGHCWWEYAGPGGQAGPPSCCPARPCQALPWAHGKVSQARRRAVQRCLGPLHWDLLGHRLPRLAGSPTSCCSLSTACPSPPKVYPHPYCETGRSSPCPAAAIPGGRSPPARRLPAAECGERTCRSLKRVGHATCRARPSRFTPLPSALLISWYHMQCEYGDGEGTGRVRGRPARVMPEFPELATLSCELTCRLSMAHKVYGTTHMSESWALARGRCLVG